MASHQPAVHRAIVVVDVEGFSDPSRTNTDQLTVRKGLYKALVWSFARAGIDIDLGGCDYDRGDGRLILVPPNIPKSCWSPSGLAPGDRAEPAQRGRGRGLGTVAHRGARRRGHLRRPWGDR